MNPKKEKLLAEIENFDRKIQSNEEKIKNLNDRNEEYRKRKRKAAEKLQDIENSEYGIICREFNVAPENLVAFLESQLNKKKQKEAEKTE